ncbi:unnamed protein product [Nippostrongylus brasiliensis]|uniref:Uncharacterized protein n=1 Tax=Nippostrongylus brasiliensis TaxID=27835 RepID=A0A0N4Y2Z0_NIPBR|nr:unnamed protein product [Nippostrongylus brasiliensis]
MSYDYWQQDDEYEEEEDVDEPSYTIHDVPTSKIYKVQSSVEPGLVSIIQHRRKPSPCKSSRNDCRVTIGTLRIAP